LIHNIRQFGEHWSWRCGVQWTRASEGWKSGACRYDHTVGSWDELVQQSAEHLAEWHGITPVRAAGAVPDTPPAVVRVDDESEEFEEAPLTDYTTWKRYRAVPDTGHPTAPVPEYVQSGEPLMAAMQAVETYLGYRANAGLVNDILIGVAQHEHGDRIREAFARVRSAAAAVSPGDTPRAGDRVQDGGQRGTLVRCPQCSGDGLLLRLDPEELERMRAATPEPSGDTGPASPPRDSSTTGATSSTDSNSGARARDGHTPDVTAEPEHVVTKRWDAAGGEVLARICSCGEGWTRDDDRCPEDDSDDTPDVTAAESDRARARAIRYFAETAESLDEEFVSNLYEVEFPKALAALGVSPDEWAGARALLGVSSSTPTSEENDRGASGGHRS
jgi:hypothetical protein